MGKAWREFANGLFSLREGVGVCVAALFAGEAGAGPVNLIEAQSNDICTGEGNGGFRNQSAAERNLSDEFARDSPPTEGASDDSRKLDLLFLVADWAPIDRGNHQRHPDLIHREKSRVRSELTDRPRELKHIREHIREGSDESEQRVFA